VPPPIQVSSPRKRGPIWPLAQGDSWVPAFAGMTRGGLRATELGYAPTLLKTKGRHPPAAPLIHINRKPYFSTVTASKYGWFSGERQKPFTYGFIIM
jgi:hypothetical protein